MPQVTVNSPPGQLAMQLARAAQPTASARVSTAAPAAGVQAARDVALGGTAGWGSGGASITQADIAWLSDISKLPQAKRNSRSRAGSRLGLALAMSRLVS